MCEAILTSELILHRKELPNCIDNDAQLVVVKVRPDRQAKKCVR